MSQRISLNVVVKGDHNSVNINVRPPRRRGRKPPLGFVLYRGPSVLDKTPIVVVATGILNRSENEKVGDAIQTWILCDDDADPAEAHISGEDFAICGSCPHAELHTCYVNLIQAPLQVYKSLQQGRYTTFNRRRHAAYIRGRYVRFGSYGDPAAVPLRVWKELAGLCQFWTGYTHQWRDCNPAYADYCMASVETPLEGEQARSLGFRTFRTRLPDQPLEPGEFVCPASKEAGKRLTCEQCKACNGRLDSPTAASPCIVFHGPRIAGNWQLRRYTEYVKTTMAAEQN